MGNSKSKNPTATVPTVEPLNNSKRFDVYTPEMFQAFFQIQQLLLDDVTLTKAGSPAKSAGPKLLALADDLRSHPHPRVQRVVYLIDQLATGSYGSFAAQCNQQMNCREIIHTVGGFLREHELQPILRYYENIVAQLQMNKEALIPGTEYKIVVVVHDGDPSATSSDSSSKSSNSASDSSDES